MRLGSVNATLLESGSFRISVRIIKLERQSMLGPAMAPQSKQCDPFQFQQDARCKMQDARCARLALRRLRWWFVGVGRLSRRVHITTRVFRQARQRSGSARRCRPPQLNAMSAKLRRRATRYVADVCSPADGPRADAKPSHLSTFFACKELHSHTRR